MADADQMFGDGEVKLRSLTDTAGIFRRSERDKLEYAMNDFGENFPQMFIAVYSGTLGETGSLRQFGFWLMNRGVFEDVDMKKPNEAGVLFVIDPDSKSAGITYGYLLDPFFEEHDSFDCLSRAHSYWLEEKYAEGLLKAIKHLKSILRKRSRQAKKDPERFERKVATPVAVEDLVKKIRSGGRKSESVTEVSEISEEEVGS